MNAKQKFSRRKFVSSAVSASAISVLPGAQKLLGEFTGGIDAPDKALAALQAGATACAYFTGFITRGPLLARRTLDALVKARR